MTDRLLLGQTLTFSGNPFHVPWDEVTHLDSAGGVLIRQGRIAEVGSAATLRV